MEAANISAIFSRFSSSQEPDRALAGSILSRRASSAELRAATILFRSPSCDSLRPSRSHTLRRLCSASLDCSADGEFARIFHDPVLGFPISVEEARIKASPEPTTIAGRRSRSFRERRLRRPLWAEDGEIVVPAERIERTTNSIDLPFSLRCLKRKRRLKEGGCAAAPEGEEPSACSSVRRAFSSMVFIVRELQSSALHMRETLFCEDLQAILARVQREINTSFVWLFQQIFSHTPVLMVSVMILLANFTVHSMSGAALTSVVAASAAAPPPTALVEVVSAADLAKQPAFESAEPETVGGAGGSGTVARRVAGPSDAGEGPSEQVAAWTEQRLRRFQTEEPTAGLELAEEVVLWRSVVEEASRMQVETRDEALEHETMLGFVTASMEPEDASVYHWTELLYQRAVSEDPSNALVLCNYAQFLHLVVRNYDRAEEYFKRAVAVEPVDAESLSRYANFLWVARKDLGAAEETYIGAMEADPTNSFYAANYAHFLWNTGGHDTCFSLS